MITPSENGISGDGSQYYGSAEYYSEKNDLGEVQASAHAPMQWVGHGAELLGLPSEIKTEHDLKVFDDLIKGKLPDGREMPAITDSGKDRRTGEDIVMSAPKSVSIMATYGGDERILEAHNRAVLRTVEKIQERMMAVRGMVDGKQEKVDGESIIALAQHLDARPVAGFTAADLHTHALFMNVAIRSSDGEIRAVTWDKYADWQKDMNATYLSELAHELRDLGYDSYKTKDAFEIVGISREMIEDFSPRAKAIEKELEKMGLTRATASKDQKQDAAFKIREDKEHVTHEQMLAQGNKLASEKGYDFQSVREAALLNERHETHEQRMDFAAEALKSAARHFSERQSVFEAKEVIKHALAVGLPKGTTEHELRQAWVERKDKHGLLTAKSPIDPKTGERSTERWITTRLAVARDEKMIKNLQAGKGAISDRLTNSQVAREIATLEARKGFALGTDQAKAIHMTLEAKDRVTCWQGRAGTGKTTTVEGIKQAMEAQGYKVIGLAPTTKAVAELAGVGIESESIAMWSAKGAQLDNKTFVIIDESGMCSSKDLAKLVDRIEKAGARALFIGDWRQLQSVAAGAPFKKMQEYCPTAELTQIQRQKNPEMREIAELFSSGRAAEAAQKMGQFMTQINTEGLESVKEVNEALASDAALKYLALPDEKPHAMPDKLDIDGKPYQSQARENTLIVVATNAVREMVNNQVREGLRSEGKLGAEDALARTLHAEKPTEEQLRQAFWYEGKMKDEDGQKVQLVIIPAKDYAVHGVRFSDEKQQKDYLEWRAMAADINKQGGKMDAPTVLQKGEQYHIQSVDLQKAEVHITDSQGREIIWKPDEAGKVTAYEECSDSKFAAGDRVIFKENQKIQQPDGTEAKVFNGQRGTVQAVHGDTIIIKTAQGEDVAIDKNAGIRVEHAYSGTVHSFQGATDGYGIKPIRAGSQMNDANQGYVGETRFKYGVEVITDNISQLQKDWSQYKYQQNAIDYAESKDLQKFNPQTEEKKMEIVEKEDSLDKAQAAPSKDVEPEKGTRDTHETAPGKDAEREAPESATRETEAQERDTHETAQEATSRDAVWDENVPAATGEHEYTGTGPEPSPYDPEKTEKEAERATATEAAREPVVWDESVPLNTGEGEHEHAGSAPPEPSPIHGQQERMDDAMGEQHADGKAPAQESMAPPAKADMTDWAAYAAADKAMEERRYEVKARVSWYGDRGPENDVERDIARSLAEEHSDLYKDIHAQMEKDRAIDPTAHPDPYLNPQARAQAAQVEPEKPEPEKGPASEKETPQREEKAQTQPEPAPREPEATRPPMDKLAQLVNMQMQAEKERDAAHNAKVMAELVGKQPEHVNDAGRAAYNEAVLGRDAVQAQRGQAPTHDKDKGGMEREI